MERETGTTQLLTPLETPVTLDAMALYAEDGMIAGPQMEVSRAVQYLKTRLPEVGLEFSKLEVSPAKPESGSFDRALFEPYGCSINFTGDMESMKSPIGSDEHCETYAMNRVGKAMEVYKAIAALPKHNAFYLARYQASRMTFSDRTTPRKNVVEPWLPLTLQRNALPNHRSVGT